MVTEIVAEKPMAHYTVQEAAVFLKLSTGTVYTLIQRGVLRASTVSRKKLIPARDVETLVERTC